MRADSSCWGGGGLDMRDMKSQWIFSDCAEALFDVVDHYRTRLG